MDRQKILRTLLDVATGKTEHLRLGSCPEPETGHPEWRDQECPACQVLVAAEAAAVATCETCGGRGEIGGFQGGEAPGYVTEPCPDCAPIDHAGQHIQEAKEAGGCK